MARSSSPQPRSNRSRSSRDATVLRFLPLADSLARQFHRRFPQLLERDDLIQQARLALTLAAARLQDERTAPAYLKRCITGALAHHLRDRALLVRIPARHRAQAAGTWQHLSLDAPGPDGVPPLDLLPAANAATPDPLDAPPSLDSLEAAAIAQLLDQLPARQAAALRLTLLQGLSLRQAAAQLQVSAMTVSRCRQQALTQLRHSLAASSQLLA